MKNLIHIGNHHFNFVDYQFEVYQLGRDVISCNEAAYAKGIPLKNELKTLIIETNNGLCTINISGENQISLRKVKNYFNIKNAYLASMKTLVSMNLLPGAVCPFLDQLWHLPLLIDKNILNLAFTSTNNGKRNEYIIFPPEILLLAPKYIIGDFIK